MFRKVFLLSAAMLLLASWRAFAMPVKCGTTTAEECNKELAMEMDKEVMEMFKEMLKTQMQERMNLYTAVKEDMPADSKHAKFLTKSLEDMKTQMTMLDKMDDKDEKKIEESLVEVFVSMDPEYENTEIDSANAIKYQESMDKHLDKQKMLEGPLKMMEKFETMWTEMLHDLRPEDIEEYPQYKEMKEELKTLEEMANDSKKMNMFRKMIKMMLDLHETPNMKVLYNILTNGCDKCGFVG